MTWTAWLASELGGCLVVAILHYSGIIEVEFWSLTKWLTKGTNDL